MQREAAEQREEAKVRKALQKKRQAAHDLRQNQANRVKELREAQSEEARLAAHKATMVSEIAAQLSNITKGKTFPQVRSPLTVNPERVSATAILPTIFNDGVWIGIFKVRYME